MSEIRDRDELVLTVNRLMICAMEDIDCGRNEASPTTLDLVRRIEDNDAALRLALETATREAEEERRTAEATLKFLGRIAEVTWEAGLPSGDREQTLANVRALASRPAPPADAAREAVPTRDDAMTLIGHAEYLRKCHGEEDMPRFFDALAQKILALPSPSPAPSAPARDIVKAIREQTERLSPPKPFDPLGGFAPAPSAPAMRKGEVKP